MSRKGVNDDRGKYCNTIGTEEEKTGICRLKDENKKRDGSPLLEKTPVGLPHKKIHLQGTNSHYQGIFSERPGPTL